MTFFEILGLREIIRYILFPGSLKLMRRGKELEFMADRGKIMLKRMKCLLELVECIEQNNSYLLIDFSSIRIAQIAEQITSMIKSYQKLSEHQALSSYQSQFSEIILNVSTQLKKSVISIESITFNLWDVLQSADLLSDLKNNSTICKFQSDTLTNDLKTALMEAQDLLQEVIKFSELPWKKRLTKWLKDDTFGSLEYFKAELQTVYPLTKAISLQTYDKKKLDCLMIYAAKSESKDCEDSILKEVPPTIIFSNPNASFYELSRYSNEWVDYYWKKGINVFLWNYRGYGKSEGVPSPSSVLKDAEYVVNYLRETEKVGLLGTHGQSLGGMVSCHIASKKNLDFLCADRTFSCVSDIALHSMGVGAKILVRLITGFDVWSASSYYKAQCYKVLAYDANDEIICYLASLKNGVSRQIAQTILSNESQENTNNKDSKYNYHQDHNESFLKNCRGFLLKTFKRDETVEKAINAWITEPDQRIIFNSLKRLLFLTKHILEQKKSSQSNTQEQKNKSMNEQTPSKIIQIELSANNNVNNNNKNTSQAANGNNNQQQQKNQLKLDSSLDYSSVINGSMLIDGIKEEEKKNFTSSQSQPDQSATNISNFNGNSINAGDLSVSSQSPKSSFNNSQDIESQQKQQELLKQQLSEKQSKDQQKKEESLDSFFLQYESQDSQALQKLFKSVYSLFNSYDSGGITLLEIFSNYSNNNEAFQVFQLFLLNLNIWGSYLPLNQIIRKNMSGTMPKKYGYAKTKEAARKLEKITKDNQNMQEVPNGLFNLIMRDLSTVARKLRSFSEKMQAKQLSLNSGEVFDCLVRKQSKDQQPRGIETDFKSSSIYQDPSTIVSNGSAAVSLSSGQNTPEKNKMQRLEDQLKVYQNLKEESQPSQLIEQEDANKILGNLLPLQCGHNGNFSNFELSLLGFHLKNAGFVNKIN